MCMYECEDEDAVGVECEVKRMLSLFDSPSPPHPRAPLRLRAVSPAVCLSVVLVSPLCGDGRSGIAIPSRRSGFAAPRWRMPSSSMCHFSHASRCMYLGCDDTLYTTPL